MEFTGDARAIPKQLEPFYVSSAEHVDLSIRIVSGKGGMEQGETILLHNNELNVYEGESRWHLEFPPFDNVTGVYIDKDLRHAEIRIRYEEERIPLRENLFHVLRHMFLLKAQSLGLFAIHSASILYRGKAYLFSGPSGTGKSTHTALWHEAFGTEYLNGDLNLLSDEGIVYGIPWCGTSELFTVKEYPLGGIVFLKQAKDDRVEVLEGDQKSLRIAQRLISPTYNKEQLEENLGFSVRLGAQIPCWRLFCTKNVSAAELMKNTIDRYWNRSFL